MAKAVHTDGAPPAKRCTVFLTDMAEFAKMNEVYGRYFTTNPPARTTVQIAATPTKGAKVEIDAIAVR